MENKYYTAIFWVVNIFLFVILLLTAIGTHDYFYNMEKTNCNNIMNADYSVATEDVASCMRLTNYPFWEFTAKHYVVFGFMHFILALVINFVIYIIKDVDYDCY